MADVHQGVTDADATVYSWEQWAYRIDHLGGTLVQAAVEIVTVNDRGSFAEGVAITWHFWDAVKA